MKEKEKSLSKQNEIIEALERANCHLNDETTRNKEKLAQSQVNSCLNWHKAREFLV